MGTLLITGTTSGLGLELARHYSDAGNTVIGVNRRETPEPNHHCLDITDYEQVLGLLRELKASNTFPDTLILNAGINRPDNAEQFDYPTFQAIMNTNLNGVLTFVGALRELNVTKTKIVCLSSTSNIIPNAGHIGYHLSKWAIKRAFELFAKNDPKNHYQSIVLGPVHTNIMRHSPPLKGLQKFIFDLLAVDAHTAATACARFIKSRRSTFLYPWRACAFYYAVRLLLRFFPGLYKGTQNLGDLSLKVEEGAHAT